jgi:GNAT superfamily N-acetyltransferase
VQNGEARIRTAEPGDEAAIRAVCAASLTLEPNADGLAEILLTAPGERLALVAESGGTVAGICCGSLRSVPGAAPDSARSDSARSDSAGSGTAGSGTAGSGTAGSGTAGSGSAGSGTARSDTARAVRGHIDLLAVAPANQRLGIGTALLQAAERELAARGAGEFRLSGNAPVYLWPGVDVRYTVMTCLAERAGYERCNEAVNMAAGLRAGVSLPGGTGLSALRAGVSQPGGGTGPVGLAPQLSTEADERRLAAAGITVRRAAAAEAGPLVRWMRQGPFGDSSWPDEVSRALDHDPPGCHVAARDGDYLGFACHGVVRPDWFGPMGTLASERRAGIGAVLLKRCLADIAVGGYDIAQIGWTGPVRFYARAVGAVIDRVFWLYRKGPAE